jgi:hypothetical protein
MPACRPDHPDALANDVFRRSVGREAVARGRITLEDGIEALPMRLRRTIVAAVRAYDFDADASAPDETRSTATVTVHGAVYRFTIERDHSRRSDDPDDDAAHLARVLRIGLA